MRWAVCLLMLAALASAGQDAGGFPCDSGPIVLFPRAPLDTIEPRTFQPAVAAYNGGSSAASFVLYFSMWDPDSSLFFSQLYNVIDLGPGDTLTVVFSPVMFRTHGRYRAKSWYSEVDSVTWVFWVLPGGGVEEETREGRWRSRVQVPTVMRAADLVRVDCRLIDAQGRDVTDRRDRLAPGVYFLKDEGGRLKDEPGSRTAVRKVVVQW